MRIPFRHQPLTIVTRSTHKKCHFEAFLNEFINRRERKERRTNPIKTTLNWFELVGISRFFVVACVHHGRAGSPLPAASVVNQPLFLQSGDGTHGVRVAFLKRCCLM